MSDGKKELTQQEYLVALGLFTLANQAQRQSDAAADGLAKHLGRDGYNDLGHISDTLYSPDGRSLEKLLKLEGITVLPE